MIGKYIDFKIFLISLAFGILVVYLYQPNPTVVYVYPTPDNINTVQLKDKADNCFKFNAVEVDCPSDKSKISHIPIQSNSEPAEANNSLF